MIAGKWYEQGSAAQKEAALHCYDDGRYTLVIQSGGSYSGQMEDIQVSDRLGNVERKLTFPDGSVFATQANDAIDRYFKPQTKAASFIHGLESRLVFVAIALIIAIATTFSFFKWGLPAISHGIASVLPQKTNDIIGAHTLTFLDDFLLDESRLDEATKEKIRTRFKNDLVPLEANDELNFTLHFRAWGEGDESIPNALALPSGDIILTDKFVELSENQDEIDAVLLHEMGHVAHRHSLKMVVQSTLITVIVTMVTGDGSGMADLGVGLGSLLLSTSYSRDFETEADEYAFQHMLKADIDPNAFATIIRRITDFTVDISSDEDTEKPNPKETNNDIAEQDKDSKDVLDYFSTHPNTDERVKQAKRYSDCYRQGLKVCE